MASDSTETSMYGGVVYLITYLLVLPLETAALGAAAAHDLLRQSPDSFNPLLEDDAYTHEIGRAHV